MNTQEMQNYRTSFLTEPYHVNTNYRDWKKYFSDREMNNFRFMIMSAELMKANGKVDRPEVIYLRNLYIFNCGERYINHYMRLLEIILGDTKSELEWALSIRYGSYSMNMEMVARLFELAGVDGKITLNEFLFVKTVAERIGVSRSDFMKMTQKYNIDSEYENHTFEFNQGFASGLSVSFLAKSPGQYHIRQYYENWCNLCFNPLEQENDKRNLSFLVLASVVITADGPINQAELTFMEKLYAQNCGGWSFAKIYIQKLHDILKEDHVDWQTYADNLYNIFYEEDRITSVCHYQKTKKEEIVETLFRLAEVDSRIKQNELGMIWAIAQNLEVEDAFKKIASKFDIAAEDTHGNTKTAGTPLARAYAIMQINENATDEMVKRAYHKLAQQYHPDRCQNEQQRNCCEAKMRELIEAYNTIMKSRKTNN